VSEFPGFSEVPDNESSEVDSGVSMRPINFAFFLNNYDVFTFYKTTEHEYTFHVIHPDHFPK